MTAVSYFNWTFFSNVTLTPWDLSKCPGILLVVFVCVDQSEDFQLLMSEM